MDSTFSFSSIVQKKLFFRITERGKTILKGESINEINESVLKRFPEFMKFKYGKTDKIARKTPVHLLKSLRKILLYLNIP